MSQEKQGTKVIIAGCGIAGPVLATFLKIQGYAPIVYERLESLTESGVSLWYVSPKLGSSSG